MKGRIITETPRLIVRQFTSGDTAFIFDLLNSPGWLKYIGNRNISNESDALRYLLEGPLKQNASKEFALWKVELKEGGQPVGMCGFLKRDNLDLPDIGFAFLPQFNGAGYAIESARGCLDYAASIHIDRICAITLPENKSSIRLIEKLGLRFEREVVMSPGDEVLHLFTGETKKALKKIQR